MIISLFADDGYRDGETRERGRFHWGILKNKSDYLIPHLARGRHTFISIANHNPRATAKGQGKVKFGG